jgi:glycosyltransferase involved in cell wall biosynthesis
VEMRILFAVHQFLPEHRAGTEVLTLGLARGFAARGHRTAVFAARRSAPVTDLQPGGVEDGFIEGVPVRRVGRPRESLARSFRLNYDNPVMAARMREYVREFRPDVVHFMHLQGLSASVIPAVKSSGLPALYTATDFWAICPVVDLRRHDGVLCEGPDMVHCPRCLAGRMQTSRLRDAALHAPDPALRAAEVAARTPLAQLVPPLRQLRDLRKRPDYIRRQVNSLDRVLAPTRLARDLLVRNGVDPRLVEVRRYGLDTSRIEAAVRAPRDSSSSLRIGFIGTLGPHKGCDLLIRAFRRLPGSGAALAIYGEPAGFGDFYAHLKRLAAGDGRIEFRRPFPPQQIGEVLAGLDVLVVPSRWYENTPLVVYSAFAAGVPVVATDLGGLSEVVEHGKNGLLFKLDSADDLSDNLRRLLAEPDLLERLRAGTGPVKRLEDYVKELEELYTGLVERKRGER